MEKEGRYSGGSYSQKKSKKRKRQRLIFFDENACVEHLRSVILRSAGRC